MGQQQVVICGAGIAGISIAYHLAVTHDEDKIFLVDERPPLSLTSDKSTECYRNWWPGPGDAMVSFMNRSIDLLENLARVHGNPFHLNRRGYLYLTSDPGRIPEMIARSQEISRLGAGPVRIHPPGSSSDPYQPSNPQGFSDAPSGADLLLDPEVIRRHYPFLSPQVVAGLHVRRAGWFSAQQLGSLLLEAAREKGVRLINDRVVGIDQMSGRVSAVNLAGGERIPTRNFVNAGGPFVKQLAAMLDVDLPVFCELHQKASIADHRCLIPRDAPLLIWQDPQHLPWSTIDKDFLVDDPASEWLLNEFPSGVHTRPEGLGDSPIVLMLWEYQTQRVEPTWPPELDQAYPEVALRGLSTMIPALSQYFENPPRPYLDGGYYTRTTENRPLIGPLPVEGAWVIGALSGFGLMAAMAAGELLAVHMLDKPLPDYARAFTPQRYQDAEYLTSLSNWEDTGQL